MEYLDQLIRRLSIKTPTEKIAELRKKTFYHITDWKERKRLQKNRKKMIRRLKKEFEKSI